MRVVRCEIRALAVVIGAQEVVQTLLTMHHVNVGRTGRLVPLVALAWWLEFPEFREGGVEITGHGRLASGGPGGSTKGTLSSVTVRKMSGRISALQAAGNVPLSWPTTPATCR